MIVVILLKVIASTYLQCVTKTFQKSRFFCNRCLQKSDIDMFPSLQDFVASTSVDTRELFVIMSQHLKGSAINFCPLFFRK